MNRSITLPLTLAVALASQFALGGCSKKEDVNTPPADTSASAASAPDMSSSASVGTASAPMDSISSASAAMSASSGAMAASR